VHTFRLAEAIVETLRACSARRVTIERFIRENAIAFTAGDRQVQPDCFFRLATVGRLSNLAFEIDNSMASVDAHAANSIRQKLTTYERYQSCCCPSGSPAARSGNGRAFASSFSPKRFPAPITYWRWPARLHAHPHAI
jgi:hypothetical protein